MRMVPNKNFQGQVKNRNIFDPDFPQSLFQIGLFQSALRYTFRLTSPEV